MDEVARHGHARSGAPWVAAYLDVFLLRKLGGGIDSTFALVPLSGLFCLLGSLLPLGTPLPL